MLKTVFMVILIIVVGALLGNLLGEFLMRSFPTGMLHDIVAKEISAGLEPTKLNLRILDLTFGGNIRLNLPSVLGVLCAALAAKLVTK